MAKKSSNEGAALERALTDLNRLIVDRVYLGGLEQTKLFALQKRVSQRLAAEDSAKLALEASEFCAVNLAQVEKSRAGMQQRQAEDAELGAKLLAARKEREADLAQKLEEQERRRMAEMSQQQIG